MSVKEVACGNLYINKILGLKKLLLIFVIPHLYEKF